jgi:hypothetical protein
MKSSTIPTRRIEYRDWIVYQSKEYIREEILFKGFHTISWKSIDGEKLFEYYSGDMGWSKDGYLDKNNPIPEIELEFKRTIGKDLMYF